MDALLRHPAVRIALVVLVAWAALEALQRRGVLVGDAGAQPLTTTADPLGFKFLGLDPVTGDPVRYNPCEPIPYVVNPAGMPAGALEDVQAAVGKVQEASGLRFVYEGTVDEPVAEQRSIYQPDRYGRRWPPVLIAWAPGRLFPDNVLGLGGSHLRANDEGSLVFVTGEVLLNAGIPMQPGFRAGSSRGKVMLHELGHVVGLDHVANYGQVMNDAHIPAVSDWGFGDRAALRRLGPAAGCIDTPDVP